MTDFTLFSLDELLEYAWSMLEEACVNRRKPVHLIQMATLGLDCRPKVRTVVMRDVNKSASTIRLHTDARSSKIAELAKTPFVELHAYDAQVNIQIRLSGTAVVHAAPDQIALAAWNASRAISRNCYRMEPGPGKPIVDGSAYTLPETGDDPNLGMDHFRAVIVWINAMEIVTLQHNANRRARFEFSEANVEARWLAP